MAVPALKEEPDRRDMLLVRLRNLLSQHGLSRPATAGLLRNLAEAYEQSEQHEQLRAVADADSERSSSSAATRQQLCRARKQAGLRVLRPSLAVDNERLELLAVAGLIPVDSLECDAELVGEICRLIHRLADVTL